MGTNVVNSTPVQPYSPKYAVDRYLDVSGANELIQLPDPSTANHATAIT